MSDYESDDNIHHAPEDRSGLEEICAAAAAQREAARIAELDRNEEEAYNAAMEEFKQRELRLRLPATMDGPARTQAEVDAEAERWFEKMKRIEDLAAEADSQFEATQPLDTPEPEPEEDDLEAEFERMIGKKPQLHRSGKREREEINLVSDSEEEEPAPKRKAKSKKKEKKPKANKKSTRICSAVKISGTAAQCNWTIEELRDALIGKFGAEINYSIVRERHQDGGYHFHFYVWRRQKMQVHSNILKSGGRKKPCQFKECWDEQGWLRYMNKEEGAEHLSNMDGGLMGAKSVQELYQRARRLKGEYAAAKDLAQLDAARVALTKQSVAFNPVFEFETFNIPGKLVEWHRAAFAPVKKTTRFPILVVHGPTQRGKTQMVRTYLHKIGIAHGYCKGHNRPRAWLMDIKAMILDDLEEGEQGSKTKEPNKGWTGTDPSVITGKYMVRSEMPGMPVIIICNDRPGWLDEPYWLANAIEHKVTRNCYK